MHIYYMQQILHTADIFFHYIIQHERFRRCLQHPQRNNIVIFISSQNITGAKNFELCFFNLLHLVV
jgi:hypothetical protein